jgi:NOL1/NOP2/sun family putative RNA methylase
MSRLLGAEAPAFLAALDGEPVHGLRVNTLKISAEDFRAISPLPLGERIPWADSAFLLASQERLGRHPYHLAGLFYLQDPSAMAPAKLLDPQPGERVLDLSAAPGGKTTQLAALMQGGGLLVANEIKDKRIGHLAQNVERWGAGNVVITNETPERLADHFGPFFDRVLVDAPCSGEGMFRKDMGARLDWSPEMVAGCAVRQNNILRVAAKLVRPGGHLLYSTCTFAPEENEIVILKLLDAFPEYAVEALPEFPGFQRGRPDWAGPGPQPAGRLESLAGARRLFPHRVTGDGHFVCRLQRGADIPPQHAWIDRGPERVASLHEMNREEIGLWSSFAEQVLAADFPADRLRVRGERLYLVAEALPEFGNLRLVHPGVWFGNFKKDRFEPAHPLALHLRKVQTRRVLDLSAGSRELAAYLRGETLACEGTPGWTLVCADGWPLGWGKSVQGRLKNHYPRGWQNYS